MKKRKLFKCLNLFLLLCLATPVWAQQTSGRPPRLYRAGVTPRTFGADQGVAGSCQSEAETGALESAFANRGLPIRLSQFYRHAKLWARSRAEESIRGSLQLDLSGPDLDLLDRAGAFVPYYMWPEDNTGVNPYNTGVRPGPARAAVIDPAFPTAESLGFQKVIFPLDRNHRDGIDHIKTELMNNNAVVLSMQGSVLAHFDRITGLVNEGFHGNESSGRVSHAVAVVGYDDTLYADGRFGIRTPGALIIRNSWNSYAYFNETVNVPTTGNPAQLQADLDSFRLNVYSSNLPGFFALPYQYVQELMDNSVERAQFHVMSLNYNAYFNAYETFKRKYEIKVLPFVCDSAQVEDSDDRTSGSVITGVVDLFQDLYSVLTNPNEEASQRASARRRMNALVLRNTENINLTGISVQRFNYAKVAVNRELTNIDRVNEFYSGSLVPYYCRKNVNDSSLTDHKVWPDASFLRMPEFRSAIDAVSLNPSSISAWSQLLRSLRHEE